MPESSDAHSKGTLPRPPWHAPALVFFTGFVLVLTSIALFLFFSR